MGRIATSESHAHVAAVVCALVLLAATAHNQRHLVCGGLYRVILAQAQELLLTAAQQGRWQRTRVI